MQIRFLAYLKRQRSCCYTDFALSNKRELSSWYDSPMRGPSTVLALEIAIKSRLLDAFRGIFTMSCWATEGLIIYFGLDRSGSVLRVSQ